MVINYNSLEEAEMFEQLIKETGIYYEKAEEEVEDYTMYLFAVHEKDFDKAQKINFKVHGTHRSPMIKHRGFRWAIVIFFFLVLGLAIVGYVKNTKLYAPEKVENPQE